MTVRITDPQKGEHLSVSLCLCASVVNYDRNRSSRMPAATATLRDSISRSRGMVTSPVPLTRGRSEAWLD